MTDNKTLMQYFEWYLPADGKHYQRLEKELPHLSEVGFTGLWMPPAYKGQAGIHDVGYGVYDLFDLGEFDQKGTIATKYGTKDEYLHVIDQCHQAGIEVYADMVFNHKMGADGVEAVKAVATNPTDREEEIGKEQNIEAWTVFNFPNRHGRYSDFTWDASCFSGVDYDQRKKKNSIYRLADKEWSEEVDDENGNYDYLMGADLDFSNEKVVAHLDEYAKWVTEVTKIDGFRLDACKHIDFAFFNHWLGKIRKERHRDYFAVGEYWSPELGDLHHYLEECGYCMRLFDVPLHFRFFQLNNANGHYDMGQLFKDTLVESKPDYAVTFVENHDTQAGQALQTVIADWFKPIAYAAILLRQQGIPCVFYGDYYGNDQRGMKSFKDIIDMMVSVRKKQLYGTCHDYFDHHNVVGWTFEGDEEHSGSGCAVLMSDGDAGEKPMFVSSKYAGRTFVDCLHNCPDEVILDETGTGWFKTQAGSVSVWVLKEEASK